jgi:hypothetical protein
MTGIIVTGTLPNHLWRRNACGTVMFGAAAHCSMTW